MFFLVGSMSRTKLKVDSLAIQPYYMQPELYELGKITDNFNGVELPVYDRERQYVIVSNIVQD